MANGWDYPLLSANPERKYDPINQVSKSGLKSVHSWVQRKRRRSVRLKQTPQKPTKVDSVKARTYTNQSTLKPGNVLGTE